MILDSGDHFKEVCRSVMNYGARVLMVGTLLVVIAGSFISLIAVIGEVFFFFLSLSFS